MGQPFFVNTVAASSATPNPTWLLECRSTPLEVAVIKSNGTTVFGVIKSGVPLGKITASGKYRPCGKQLVNGAQVAVTTIAMLKTDGFFVGDVVTVWDTSGAVALATTRTITAIVAGTSVTISGAAVTVDPGDYVFVEDGSGTARGFLRDGVSTAEQISVTDGSVISADQSGLLVRDAVVDEDQTPFGTALNALIKTDLQTNSNNVDILFQ